MSDMQNRMERANIGYQEQLAEGFLALMPRTEAAAAKPIIRKMLAERMADWKFEISVKTEIIIGLGLVARDELKSESDGDAIFHALYEREQVNLDIDFRTNTPREQLMRLMPMVKNDLLQVAYRPDIPYIIRQYARGILNGDIKTLNSLLDQSYGTPIERRLALNANASPLDSLTVEEIRGLLAGG